jgi:hypothetical protein
VEPSPEVAAFGERHYGLRFQVGTLESSDITPGSYDLVTLWGTDSHFLHPQQSWKKLTSALAPGGVLAMNYQDFGHWVRILFPRLKTGWNVIYNLTHLSLAEIMKQNRLTLLRKELEIQRVPLAHVARVLRLPAPAILERINLPIPAISIPLVICRKEAA